MHCSRNGRQMRSWIRSGAVIVIGLLLLCNPDFGSALVSYGIGWTAIVLGGLGCIFCIFHWESAGFRGIILAIAGVAAGIYLIYNPLMLANLFGMLTGGYLVFQGAASLGRSRKLKQSGYPGRSSLVLGITLTVLGFIFLILPLSSSRLIMTLAGIILIGSGIVSLVVNIKADRILEHGGADGNRSDIIDADE